MPSNFVEVFSSQLVLGSVIASIINVERVLISFQETPATRVGRYTSPTLSKKRRNLSFILRTKTARHFLSEKLKMTYTGKLIRSPNGGYGQNE